MDYLSDDWFEAAAAAIAAAGSAPAAVVIDQHVEAGPSWRIRLGQTCSLERLAAPAQGADAVFRQSRATAAAIARGDTGAHQAFLLGELSFDGDIARVIEARAALGWLEQVLAPVMAATE